MYITYECSQWRRNRGVKRYRIRKGEKYQSPNTISKPEFMPTKLVRICDMKVIRGSQVNEGYYALSYSWNQSGNIKLNKATGEFERVDEGKHKIISTDQKIIRRRGKKNKRIPIKVKYVNFEGIIQHICQQHSIKYIWYDQMCINQEDKEEKQREIRDMHKIYTNAYCTIALVPECRVENAFPIFKKRGRHFHRRGKIADFPEDARSQKIRIAYDIKSRSYATSILGSEWYSRLWTLEEAIKSKEILFVGQNTHIIDTFEEGHTLHSLTYSRVSEQIKLHEILYFAHQRTSTKPHDRVFALANLVPNIIDKINISYDQSIEDLMIQFYGLLAEQDITILNFQKNQGRYKSVIQDFDFLPSWTGINGVHDVGELERRVFFQNHYVIGKTLYLTCPCITNDQPDQNNSLNIRFEDFPPIPDDHYTEKKRYSLGILVRLPGKANTNTIPLGITAHHLKSGDFFDLTIHKKIQKFSRFFKIKGNLYWYSSKEDRQGHIYNFYFDSLTEDLEDPFAQYVILSGICFETNHESYARTMSYYHYDEYYPVLKKPCGEKYYKAIGTLNIVTIEIEAALFFSGCNLPEQTFLIQ